MSARWTQTRDALHSVGRRGRSEYSAPLARLFGQGRGEAGQDPLAGEPVGQLVGPRLQGGLSSAADVLQELELDRAVLALTPSAHDPAVAPGRRPGIAG